MDKLLDIPRNKFGDKEDFKYYRFQCDCLTAADAMDISVESWGKDNKNKFITIHLDFLGTNFWDRLKYALQIIRGHWTWREFIPRKEDYQYISDIFDTNKDYLELP